MNQYPVDLFDFCGDEVIHALKKFCQRVNSSDADVFIIMAHKAVLLFYLLLEQGHISERVKEKVIVSNLALDFDCSYLAGKKIAIIDDIVISGTTIASVVNKLKHVNVCIDNIKVIAVAIDQDYFEMSFKNDKGINSLYCDTKLSDAPCIELSAVISKAFSYYGIPYDVDFPAYKQIPVSKEIMDTLHNNLLWSTANVSNGNQKNGNVDAYTLFPRKPVLDRLWIAIGANLEECADVKIRLYIKRYPDGFRECCVVPMCMFKEISWDDLDVLYDLMKPEGQPLALSKEESYKAQMRYLEFYIAHQLFVILGEFTSLGHGVMFNENIAMQLFGLVDGKTVYHHLSVPCPRVNEPPLICHCVQTDCSELIREYKKSDTSNRLSKECVNWDCGNEYQKGCYINRFVFSFFLWWYDTKEIPVRKKLKEQRLHYIDDYKTIQSHLGRLKNGLSINVLCQMLQSLIAHLANKSDEFKLSDQEKKHAISLFIDRAIDEGIIVPTIYHCENEKYLCRAFRHGEDLPFGAADQYRLVHFLQTVGRKICEAEGCTIPSVAEISLEKIIVLFYQMGLRSGNIFNRFLGFGETDIIHSFLSVHGRIQGYTCADVVPHIYSESDAAGTRYITWLTVWLYRAKLIGKEPSGTGPTGAPIPIQLDAIEKYLHDNKRGVDEENILKHIDSIADLISKWYNGMVRSEKKGEFRNDITALTSCANRFVYASAIATEIHYFKKFWDGQATHALEETSNSKKLVDRLTDSDENKRHTASTTQGLYSGQTKAMWRHSGKAREVIDAVARDFLDDTSACAWAKIWNRVDWEPEDDDCQLRIQTGMAEAFLYFFSACFECLGDKEFWDFGALPTHYSDYKNNYLQLAQRIPQLDNSRFDALEKVAGMEGADLERKGKLFQELVDEALFGSEQCVKDIEISVCNMDPTYTVYYKSALILDIAAIDPKQIEPALLAYWNQISDEDNKTKLNIIKFPRDREDSSFFYKYGIFYGQIAPKPLDVISDPREDESLECGQFLYKAFKAVSNQLNGRLYQMRGIMFPHIVREFTFNHNLQRNIEKYADDFYRNIVKPLEVCYDDEKKMQLLLGLDRHVNQRFVQVFQDWQIDTLTLPIEGAEWITKCVRGVMNHTASITAPTLTERVAFSCLKVKCGSEEGLGILVRISDRVICVSCNHLFTEFSDEEEPNAVSAYNPRVSFPLHPLKQVCAYQSKDEVLPVQDEIMLLEPCWSGNIPFDISMLVSLEDWATLEVGIGCKCYGLNSENEMKWVDSLYVQGSGAYGYDQIGSKDSQIKEVEAGFSGGVYVTCDTTKEAKIIGVHEGRFDKCQKVRMIPSAFIHTVIQTLFKKGR